MNVRRKAISETACCILKARSLRDNGGQAVFVNNLSILDKPFHTVKACVAGKRTKPLAFAKHNGLAGALAKFGIIVLDLVSFHFHLPWSGALPLADKTHNTG